MVRTGVPARPVLGHQAAGFRLADEHRPAGVLQRADAAERQAAERDARRRATRQEEAAQALAVGVEELQPLAAVGGVGDDERAVGGGVERRRLDHATGFAANRHQLAVGRAGGIDAVDGVAAAIEDELLPGGDPLIAERLTELADDLHRQAANRSENLDAPG